MRRFKLKFAILHNIIIMSKYVCAILSAVYQQRATDKARFLNRNTLQKRMVFIPYYIQSCVYFIYGLTVIQSKRNNKEILIQTYYITFYHMILRYLYEKIYLKLDWQASITFLYLSQMCKLFTFTEFILSKNLLVRHF